MEEKTCYKGKGKLTESMRKKLTKAARCAIKMRSAHSNKGEAVKLLREDLRNGPYHCFGDHSRCSTDYCKVKQKAAKQRSSNTEHRQPESTENTTGTEKDMTTDISEVAEQEQRLWQDALNEENLEDVREIPPISQEIDREMMCDIQRLVGRLIAKSEQLLGMYNIYKKGSVTYTITHVLYLAGNFTTNLAESWMHIRSKFDRGKQINRSQSGSWQGRCAGAGLRQVLGPAWGPEVWKNTTGNEANSVFKSNSIQKEKNVLEDRKRKATETEKERRKQVKYRKTNDNSKKARSDYARHDGGQGVQDIAKDVPQEYLEQMMLDYYTTNVKISEQRILDIERVTRGQSTPDDIGSNIWLAERRKRITSSNTGAIAKRRATTKVANSTLLHFQRQRSNRVGKAPRTCYL